MNKYSNDPLGYIISTPPSFGMPVWLSRGYHTDTEIRVRFTFELILILILMTTKRQQLARPPVCQVATKADQSCSWQILMNTAESLGLRVKVNCVLSHWTQQPDVSGCHWVFWHVWKVYSWTNPERMNQSDYSVLHLLTLQVCWQLMISRGKMTL